MEDWDGRRLSVENCLFINVAGGLVVGIRREDVDVSFEGYRVDVRRYGQLQSCMRDSE